MKYDNIKILSADIDGTLSRSDYTISQRTLDTITKCRDRGYLFGLASGRPLEDVLGKYKEWNLDKQFDFIIGWNGCELYDDATKKSYQYNYLSKHDLKEIVTFMSRFDCSINMYDPGCYLSSRKTDRAWYSAFKNKRTFIKVDTLDAFYQHDNGGIMFRLKLEDVPMIEEKVNEFVKDKDFVGFKTQADLYEFSHKNCNKGYALKKYSELKNISLDECMAFGDTTNDNKMLECCHGVCLLNGSDDTKACAEVITDIVCDDDGWADFIDKNLIID